MAASGLSSTHMKQGTTATFHKINIKKYGSIVTRTVYRQNNIFLLDMFSPHKHANIISIRL